MTCTYTESDFDNLSWHDCNVWKIEFRVGDPDEGDWTQDLALGIDFITEWLRWGNNIYTCKIAPARLVFHEVFDLHIHIDWEKVGGLPGIFIYRIEREQIDPEMSAQNGWGLNHLNYRWRIDFNGPSSGKITFISAGFTQELLSVPVESEGDSLSLKRRNELLGETQ